MVERDDDLDVTSIATPESPFEHIIEESIMNQAKWLKQAASNNQMTLEQEKMNYYRGFMK